MKLINNRRFQAAQFTTTMNIEELKKCARQWAEENEGNRAVMLIAIERGEPDEEGGRDAEITSLVNGNGGLCTTALKQVLTDNRDDNAFREIYRNVRANILIEKIVEDFK